MSFYPHFISNWIKNLLKVSTATEARNTLELGTTNDVQFKRVQVDGDLMVQVPGSSETNPRILGMVNSGDGNAARFQIGGAWSFFQEKTGGKTQLGGYWGMELHGNHQSGSGIAFQNGGSGNPGVEIFGYQNTPTVLIRSSTNSFSVDHFAVYRGTELYLALDKDGILRPNNRNDRYLLLSQLTRTQTIESGFDAATIGQSIRKTATGFEYFTPGTGGSGTTFNAIAPINYDSVSKNLTLALATTTENGGMSSADKIKLNGIQTGATSNASDETLTNRSSHSGSQAISTITGLQTALDARTQMNAPVQLTIGANNALSALPSAPSSAGKVFIYINGQSHFAVGSTPSFSVSGTSLTWNPTNAGFNLDPLEHEAIAIVY